MTSRPGERRPADGEGVARQILRAHLLEGELVPGAEIALRIDQTLTQDATGTLVMLALEAMGIERARAALSVQYTDHNLLQTDHRNADDHLYLESACRRFGIRYSRAGNGVSHPVHQERFGRPGATLLGADSHTCAAGALGMLALGAGGFSVALAIAGEPYRLRMPSIFGVRLDGALPPGVSAKDVILELLRRHGVEGARGRIVEYHGEGVPALSAMDRHVIANMGAELGATTSVFPSDQETRRFLASERREEAWTPLAATPGTRYDDEDAIDLAALEPLIALPPSPGNVVPVREVAGRPIAQAYIGSSANPGYRDLAVAALMVRGRRVAPGVSFDLNPASREVLENLIRDGHLGALVRAGARIHQAGCNGCIGMGQAPATGRISLRTVPRNFSGRSGTREDAVYLCSPETAAASALTGKITDPRDLGPPEVQMPDDPLVDPDMIPPPPPPGAAARVEIVRGPNIVELEPFEPLPEEVAGPVLLGLGDDVSTDDILPSGARVLPFRSNVPRIAAFCFEGIEPRYAERARAAGPHFIVAGRNFGQGSSREHAALAPRHLGLRATIAVSYARIYRENLAIVGVLPLLFEDAAARERLPAGTRVTLPEVRRRLGEGRPVVAAIAETGERLALRHDLAPREVQAILAGSLLDLMRGRSTG